MAKITKEQFKAIMDKVIEERVDKGIKQAISDFIKTPEVINPVTPEVINPVTPEKELQDLFNDYAKESELK
ncbi:hypothetical protein [uncultured Clostridium sp.]|uniref:hypothetical protein n=1 Tax=uncultured Clostridium sp. TaxID=59620 RepID=UPI002616B61F|nr:hypothetical protein [uncultured Clostridium sp.]